MANKNELQKYTDFDRLLLSDNFYITMVGSILAFILSYIDLLIISMGQFGPPYNLSLTLGVIIIVAIYTRNIASASFVGLIGSIGIVSPRNNAIDFIAAYIFFSLILAIILGYLADRMRLVLSWVNFFLFSSLVIAAYFLSLSFIFNPEAAKFKSLNYDIADAGNIGTGLNLAVLEISVFVALLILVIIIKFLTKNEIILDDSSAKKYYLIGILFILTANIVSLVTLAGFSKEVRSSDMEKIARYPSHLTTVQDLFSHTRNDGFGITVEPFNIFIVIAVSTVLTAVGISLLMIGKNKGNVEGSYGGSYIVLYAASIGTLLFQIIGSYYVQNLIYPNGIFISIEMLSLYSTMVYSVLFYNQLFAIIIILILDKLKS